MKNINHYEYIVVGAGLFGCTIAERIANVLNKKVLIIEQNSHIGGFSYSERDHKTNIEVHKYGSHIFHTNDETVWKYINQFTTFNDYTHTVSALSGDKLYPMPINLTTINRFFDKNFSSHEAEQYVKCKANKTGIVSPNNFVEKGKSFLGEQLYKTFIEGYSKKHWKLPLEELSASILDRLPLRFTEDARYFSDRYQGIPNDGYGALMKNMIDSQNIEIVYNTDFHDLFKDIPNDKCLIYTGPIDRLFEYKYGKLSYLSIQFEQHYFPDKESYQGCSVVNYLDKETPYTRCHEYKFYTPLQPTNGTIIHKERSLGISSETPAYPVGTSQDKILYQQYLEVAHKYPKLILGGRLGTYRYINMDQTIALALKTFEKEINTNDN